MSSVLRKAAQQALEAMKNSHPYSNSDRDLDKHSEAITALRAALAEPVEYAVEPNGKRSSLLTHMMNKRSKEERAALAEPEPFKPDWANYRQGVKDGRSETITVTGTYEEFIEFVNMACLHETIYDDSEGRQILVLRMLDAYGMAHSWALEHTRNNLS